MEQVFALIENEIIINTIVATSSFADFISKQYEAVIDITQYSPRPGIGWKYIDGIFISPQPYNSWILDSDNKWQAPVEKPDGNNWVWDEDTLSWVQQF